VFLCAFESNAFAAEPLVIPLWPEGVPGLQTNAGSEGEFAGRYTNVHNPTLTMYAPDVAKSTGVAVIYSPGGGYVRVGDGKTDARQLPQNSSAAAQKVFALLQQRSLQIDEIIENSGLVSAQVLGILLDLELQGYLRQLPGKIYTVER